MTPADAALLVVDDNEGNRYTLTRRLKREGYTNLTTANDGKQALELLKVQEQFVPLRAAWKKRGFELDLGIGIAQGYATLGAIGFEGRWDYACIGSVTNLAARLCGDAKGGQILTNQKTLAKIEDAVEAAPLGEVTLKGIAQPVPIFNVTAFKA